jgi:L-lactate dehydrogenase complex protein LldE
MKTDLQDSLNKERTIQFFVTCILDSLYPDTAECVVRVLRRAGANVEFPEGQTCCGQPAFNAGMRTQARKMAEHTLRVFEDTSGPVVVPSGSCAAMIRYGYPELFQGDDLGLKKARELASRTYELTEFLVDILGVTDLGSQFKGSVAYHASCHLSRELGVKSQPLQLLEAVPGAQLVELPEGEECCGFGGLFSIEHPEISAAMLERKIDNIVSCGAQTVVACDAGCLAHISGGLHRRGIQLDTRHIAELLATQ